MDPFCSVVPACACWPNRLAAFAMEQRKPPELSLTHGPPDMQQLGNKAKSLTVNVLFRSALSAPVVLISIAAVTINWQMYASPPPVEQLFSTLARSQQHGAKHWWCAAGEEYAATLEPLKELVMMLHGPKHGVKTSRVTRPLIGNSSGTYTTSPPPFDSLSPSPLPRGPAHRPLSPPPRALF